MSLFKKFGIYFFCSFLCFSFSADLAKAESEPVEFERSLDLYRQKEYLQSARVLKVLIIAHPEKSLYWFNFANCLYMLNRYEQAIKYFNKVISLNSKLVTIARIYKARSLVAVGRNDQAQDLLVQVLAEPLPESLAGAARAELNSIKTVFAAEDQALEKFQQRNWLEAEEILSSVKARELSADAQILSGLVLMKQNKRREAEQQFFNLSRNRFLETEQAALVRELLKKTRKAESLNKVYELEVEVSQGSTDNAYLDGVSITPVASTLTKAGLDFGYHFLKDQELSYRLGVNANSEQLAAAPELNNLNLMLAGTISLDKEKYTLLVTPYALTQSQNNVSVMQKYGAKISAAYQLNDHEYGIDLDAATKFSASSEFYYLQGNEFSLKPYYGFWTEALYFQFGLLVGTDEVADIQYADGTALPLNQNFAGATARSAWQINSRNLLNFNLAYVQRNYKNAALPTAELRVDNEIGMFLRYTYYFLPKFSINATIEYTANTSTLGAGDVRDKNIKSNVLSLGLLWDVFE